MYESIIEFLQAIWERLVAWTKTDEFQVLSEAAVNRMVQTIMAL